MEEDQILIVYRYRTNAGYFQGDVYFDLERLLTEVELECTLAEEEGCDPIDIPALCRELKALSPGEKYRRHYFDIECLRVTSAQFESLFIKGRFQE